MPAARQPAQRKKRNTGDRPRLPVGRHHELDRVVAQRPDGTPVTVEQSILERIRTAMPVLMAAASVGVKNATFHDWRRRGARIRTRVLAGEQVTDPDELRYMQFADTVDQAEAEALATDWTRLGLIAAGGATLERTVTTVRVVDGKEESRTTATYRDRALPSEKALMWRLRNRWPELFGDRLGVEVTGADGGPVQIEATAAGVAARFREFVEATSSVVPSGGPGSPPAALEVSGAGVGADGRVGAPRAGVASGDADVPPPGD